MKGEHVKCITRWQFFVLRLNKISQELQIWITTWNRVGKLWLMMVLLSSSSQTYYLELVLHQLLETYKTIDIGACGVAVGYPLDTVKVRIQTQKQFTGIWQCVVTTVKKEGAHGFFKGMALPVTTISMTSSVVFGTYRNCLQCFSQLHGIGAPNSKIDIFLSGMAGGVAQISVMSPGDIVKVRLQCQTERKSSGFSHAKPKYSGPIHCLLTIAKEEGVLGLYRGALPLAFRDGPSYATYFLTYNTLCSQLTPAGQKEPEWTAVLLAGGVAGMAGWSVGTPMDVIKARLQMDGVREEKRFRGLVHCLTETVRHEGPGIFFKSLGINCLRAFPVNMVVFAVYEVSVRVLRSAPLDQLS